MINMLDIRLAHKCGTYGGRRPLRYIINIMHRRLAHKNFIHIFVRFSSITNFVLKLRSICLKPRSILFPMFVRFFFEGPILF